MRSPDIDPALRPDTHHVILRPLAMLVAGATLTFAAGCSSDTDQKSLATDVPATATGAAPNYDAEEKAALRALDATGKEADDHPYVTYQVLEVPGGPGGGYYYDAPVADLRTAHRIEEPGKVLRVDTPPLLADTDRNINWYAFTLAKDGVGGLAASTESTYWLALDSRLQPEARTPLSQPWGIFRYADGTCSETRDVVVNAHGNPTLINGAPASYGRVMERDAFEDEAKTEGLVPCAVSPGEPTTRSPFT